MTPYLFRALPVALACLVLGGCYTNHFEQSPTPSNLVADALNNTALTVVAVPAVVVALPVLAVVCLADSLSSPPCRPPAGLEPGCAAPGPVERPRSPTEEPCLPATYVPGWDAAWSGAGAAPLRREGRRGPGY